MVVHVVHDGGAENISEDQVRSQINILNQDFRNKNAGGVDTGIEFELANVDDKGNKTNGVTRHKNLITNFIYNSNLDNSDSFNSKEGLLKGIIQWNPKKYLNIWIVDTIRDISNQNQPDWIAYATYPQQFLTHPQFDGLVVIDDFFGTVGTGADPKRNLGHTCTHEIGHWLGLFHTYEGGCEEAYKGDCSIYGDMVCDTPPAFMGCNDNRDCSITLNTCIENSDQNDLSNNFMDTGQDVCMTTFTQGQTNKMKEMIIKFRNTNVVQ